VLAPLMSDDVTWSADSCCFTFKLLLAG